MKKLFTLLTLLVALVTSAWATDYEWSCDGQKTTLSVTAAKGSNVANSYTGYSISYGGETYTSAIKMESATTITFTTSATSTITIGIALKNGVNYAASGKATVKLTDTGSYGSTESASAISVATTGNTTENGVDVTFTDVAAGSVTISRGGAELGVFYIKVHETGAVMTQLSSPEITYTAATGEVTIGSVTNATKVTYTTDGTVPTASSDTYSAPFVVEDGTVVKAIAIGDGASYSNSNVATETVYLTGITCATPVIKKFNGSVAITTTTPNATIKYSLNDGAYNTYTRSFTLPSDATVKAYAERTGCTNSSEASQAVNVLASNKTKTIYLDFDDFTIDSYTATGKADTDAEGYVLTIGNTSKSWSSNGLNITTPDGVKKEFKLSNGAQNTLTIPAGVHVTKFTLYSIIMNASNTTANGWKEVGNTDYQTGDNDYKNVPMGAYNDLADYNTNPDVRSYDIDQTGGTITFTNAGNQLSFVIALDILGDNTSISPAKEYTTYVTPTALDFTGLELKAYVATAASASSVTLSEVTTVPAGTPLILKKASATSYDVPVAVSASAPASNLLVAGDGTTSIGGEGKYDYVLNDGVFYHASAGTIAVGKAYLHLDAAPSAPVLSIDFGGTTSISEELRVKSEEFATAPVYNLAGQRVANPTKGLYIVNGKKVIFK